MPFRFLIITCLLLAGLLLVLPVTADTAVVDTSKLIGTWQVNESHPVQGDIDTVFIINNDRTFSGNMAINDETVWTYGGTWNLQGSSITWHYTRSSLILLDAHRTETGEILTLSDDTLTYRSGSHSTVRTLQRLQHTRQQ